MTAVVLCGNAGTAPDLLVGPFDSLDDAEIWARQQPGQPSRYAAAMPLAAPDEVETNTGSVYT